MPEPGTGPAASSEIAAPYAGTRPRASRVSAIPRGERSQYPPPAIARAGKRPARIRMSYCSTEGCIQSTGMRAQLSQHLLCHTEYCLGALEVRPRVAKNVAKSVDSTGSL